MVSTRTRYIAVVALLMGLAVGGLTTVAFSVRAAGGGGGTAVVTDPISSNPNTLTVVGTGTATSAPDQAVIGLGVSVTRPNVHDAVAAANDDMNKLIGALHSAGVQDKDIQTVSLWINQQTNCCPSVVIGYNSNNQVSVTIHHLSNVSTVIMAAVDAVGNDIQLNGASLFIGNPTAQVTAARTAAMADAAARAKQWAQLAGHHVGGILSVSEVVGGYATGGCMNQCGGAGGGGGVPIQAGQTTVTVNVTVVYALLD
jgi:uncharacterized protein YggE